MEDVEVEIQVTQEYCDKGTRSSCSFCPVALAFKDVIVEPYLGEVVLGKVVIFDPLKFKIARLFPQEVSRRILAFDRGNGMEPFSFKISLPANLLRACPTQNPKIQK